MALLLLVLLVLLVCFVSSSQVQLQKGKVDPLLHPLVVVVPGIQELYNDTTWDNIHSSNAVAV